jgi:hypothetical protein
MGASQDNDVLDMLKSRGYYSPLSIRRPIMALGASEERMTAAAYQHNHLYTFVEDNIDLSDSYESWACITATAMNTEHSIV